MWKTFNSQRHGTGGCEKVLPYYHHCHFHLSNVSIACCCAAVHLVSFVTVFSLFHHLQIFICRLWIHVYDFLVHLRSFVFFLLFFFNVGGVIFLWHNVDFLCTIWYNLSRDFKLVWPYLCCWQDPHKKSARKTKSWKIHHNTRKKIWQN